MNKRRQQRAGRDPGFHAHDRAADGQRQRSQERPRRQRREPMDWGRRRAARDHPCPGDDRRRQSDAGHAQILHDRDQPHVAAEGVGHQHHCGRRARRRAPDRRRARKHFPAGERKAESGGEKDDRADQDEEHRPFAQERHHDVGGDGAGDQAADDALRQDEGPRGNSHAPLEPREPDRRRNGAEHQGRRQPRQFEGPNADERGAEKRAPLQGLRRLAQGEARHSLLGAPVSRRNCR